MNSNDIIKYFDIDPNAGSIVSDNTNLYVNLVLDKQSILNKNVKYIKICLARSENLYSPNFFHEGYSSSYERMLYRNQNNLIKFYNFEDIPISLSNNDLIYEEYTYPINLNIIKSILVETNSIDSIEFSHTFKIYFLDENKSIIENYSKDQDKKIKLSDYLPTNFSNVIFNLLRDTLTISFNDYTFNENNILNIQSGPKVLYDSSLDNNENFNKNNIRVNFSFKNISFEYDDIDLSSFHKDFKSGLIYELYKDLSINNEENKTVNVNFQYNNFLFTKELLVNKNTILSLYQSYYIKHKENFIFELFKSKISIIEINSDSSTTPLTRVGNKDENKVEKNSSIQDFYDSYKNKKIYKVIFKKLDEDKKRDMFESLESILISLKTKFNNSNRPINDLYIDSLLKKKSSLSFRNYFSLYDFFGDTNKVFYFKSVFNEDNESILIHANNKEVYKTRKNSQDISYRSQTDQFNTSQVFSNLTQNFVFTNGKIISGLKLKNIFNNKNVLRSSNYNTENNDYLDSDIIDNTIMKYSIFYKNRFGENIEKIYYKEVSSVINSEKNQLEIDIEDLKDNSILDESNSKISVKTSFLTLPFNTLKKMTSINDDINDDDKENISTFLNKSFPNKYNDINNLVSNKIFNNSLNKKPENIYENLFSINNLSLENTFDLDLNENKNVENIEDIDEQDTNNLIKKENIIIDKLKIKNELYNISSQSSNLSFKSYNKFKLERNFIKIFKKKKDFVIASFDISKILNLSDVSSFSFNVSLMTTLEFDKNNFNQDFSSGMVLNNSLLLNDGIDHIVYDIPFIIEKSILYILSPYEENIFNISQESYLKANSIWGKNNSLYIKNILERYCIIVKDLNNNRQKIISFNNYINKDLSMTNNISNKTYVINRNVRMPNILFKYK